MSVHRGRSATSRRQRRITGFGGARNPTIVGLGLPAKAWARSSAYAPAPTNVATIQEFARAEVVGVRPHAAFRVIGKIISCRNGIPEVGSSRIVGLRNCDTLEEGRSTGGKLGKDPAICELIVKHDWIAGIIGLAVPTESRQRVLFAAGPKSEFPLLSKIWKCRLAIVTT